MPIYEVTPVNNIDKSAERDPEVVAQEIAAAYQTAAANGGRIVAEHTVFMYQPHGKVGQVGSSLMLVAEHPDERSDDDFRLL